MTKDSFRYEEWIEESLRSVVHRALAYVAENGLAGDHHFYITFRTDTPGVTLPDRLRARYPQEMTVVLQYQFWDLVVTSEAFEVTLSFDGHGERLRVPFSAVTSFADPAVKFGLQFRPAVPAPVAAPAAIPAPSPAPVSPPAVAPLPSADAGPAPGAKVITLDTFRKK